MQRTATVARRLGAAVLCGLVAVLVLAACEEQPAVPKAAAPALPAAPAPAPTLPDSESAKIDDGYLVRHGARVGALYGGAVYLAGHDGGYPVGGNGRRESRAGRREPCGAAVDMTGWSVESVIIQWSDGNELFHLRTNPTPRLIVNYCGHTMYAATDETVPDAFVVSLREAPREERPVTPTSPAPVPNSPAGDTPGQEGGDGNGNQDGGDEAADDEADDADDEAEEADDEATEPDDSPDECKYDVDALFAKWAGRRWPVADVADVASRHAIVKGVTAAAVEFRKDVVRIGRRQVAPPQTILTTTPDGTGFALGDATYLPVDARDTCGTFNASVVNSGHGFSVAYFTIDITWPFEESEDRASLRFSSDLGSKAAVIETRQAGDQAPTWSIASFPVNVSIPVLAAAGWRSVAVPVPSGTPAPAITVERPFIPFDRNAMQFYGNLGTGLGTTDYRARMRLLAFNRAGTATLDVPFEVTCRYSISDLNEYWQGAHALHYDPNHENDIHGDHGDSGGAATKVSVSNAGEWTVYYQNTQHSYGPSSWRRHSHDCTVFSANVVVERINSDDGIQSITVHWPVNVHNQGIQGSNGAMTHHGGPNGYDKTRAVVQHSRASASLYSPAPPGTYGHIAK